MAIARSTRDGVATPFNEIERLHDEINKLFDRSMSPALDVEERGEEFKPKKVTVTVKSFEQTHSTASAPRLKSPKQADLREPPTRTSR